MADASPPKLVPRPMVVCVLGMHRSGTSLVTRAVNLLGAALGPPEQLQPPAADNPRGFWEHRGIAALNEEILNVLGGRWSEPPPLPAGWTDDPRLDGLRQRARTLLADDFAGLDFWAWKDPRTCLTLPFWTPLVPRPFHVLCLRNPLEVARSLEARDRLARPAGLALWAEYVRAALAHSAGAPRLVVSYERFLEDPPGQLRRLGRFLDREGEASTSAVQAALDAFVDQTQRHHRHTPADLEAEAWIPREARLLYDVLRMLADDSHHVGVEILSALSDALAAANDQTVQRLAERDRVAVDLCLAEGRLAEARAHIDELQDALRLAHDAAAAREIERDAARRDLEAITTSRSYPLLLAIWGLHERLAPRGSRRWEWLERVLRTR